MHLYSAGSESLCPLQLLFVFDYIYTRRNTESQKLITLLNYSFGKSMMYQPKTLAPNNIKTSAKDSYRFIHKHILLHMNVQQHMHVVAHSANPQTLHVYIMPAAN